MNILLDDISFKNSLFPFGVIRSVAHIRIGILTILEKWQFYFPGKVFIASENLSLPVDGAEWIQYPANLIPSYEFLKKVSNHNAKLPFTPDSKILEHPWQIFEYNDWAIRQDFKMITEGRISEEISSSCHVVSPGNIFIEPGARLEFSILNAEAGPIYIAENAEIQEGCLLRLVGHHEVANDAECDRRQAFGHEHDLPALEAEQAVQAHQAGRDRCADRHGDRQANQEARDDAGMVAGRKPVGEVEDHAREEPGLGNPEEQPQGVEARFAPHEHHRGGHDPPGDHDPRDPDARPEPVQQQVARDLEDGVAQEEDPGAESVRGVAQADVRVHLQRREPDVYAIQVGDDVQQEHERDQAAGHLPLNVGFHAPR